MFTKFYGRYACVPTENHHKVFRCYAVLMAWLQDIEQHQCNEDAGSHSMCATHAAYLAAGRPIMVGLKEQSHVAAKRQKAKQENAASARDCQRKQSMLK